MVVIGWSMVLLASEPNGRKALTTTALSFLRIVASPWAAIYHSGNRSQIFFLLLGLVWSDHGGAASEVIDFDGCDVLCYLIDFFKDFVGEDLLAGVSGS